MGSNKATHAEGEFRTFLPDLSKPRFVALQKQNAYEYATEFKQKANPPWLHALYLKWLELYKEPFKGITNDGVLRSNLYELADEQVPVSDIADAANSLLGALTEADRAKTLYHIDSPEWRTWSNPEFLLSPKGIRLDEADENTRERILDVLRKTLSPEGFEKAMAAMRINGFLGELVNARSVCNEFSYNFCIFGLPSKSKPWGFSFYGHHLCLNIFLYKSQMVISPWFTGAEPNEIDQGPYSGTRILQREDRLGLKLMQSLSPSQQQEAQIYKLLRDPSMPRGRWNHDDQRHLCGAYRDNRVVPYEGITVSSMTNEQRQVVEDIIAEFLLYLPSRSREVRLSHVRKYFEETYFCWIGGFGDSDSFYYRIQSPVIIVEFDHHSGVFLNNEEPAKFHIHTLMRTPNGGDYGKALMPLLPGEDQAFVWEENEPSQIESSTQVFQDK